MKTIAHTTQTTTATPQAIFALWADINNWATYDDGIEWAKTTDPFAVGSHYTIKPKGGPKVKATIEIVETDKHFVDVSHLPGARLAFDHKLSQQAGVTTVDLTMSLSGPLTWLWTRILGKNQQADLEKSTAKLIATAEGKS